MPQYHCQKIHTFPKNIFVAKSRYAGKSRKKWLYQRKKSMQFTLKSTLWRDIVMEDLEIENYLKKKEHENQPTFACESKYIKNHLYPSLIPAFQRMCAATLKHCAHCVPVTFFNFLDFLAEILYNCNREHPERKKSWTSIYRVFENKEFYKSRPFYKYRLFLTPDEAATIIQARVRGYQTRSKINLEAMRVERDKILEAKEKQQKCFDTYKDIIANIRDCVCDEGKRDSKKYETFI